MARSILLTGNIMGQPNSITSNEYDGKINYEVVLMMRTIYKEEEKLHYTKIIDTSGGKLVEFINEKTKELKALRGIENITPIFKFSFLSYDTKGTFPPRFIFDGSKPVIALDPFDCHASIMDVCQYETNLTVSCKILGINVRTNKTTGITGPDIFIPDKINDKGIKYCRLAINTDVGQLRISLSVAVFEGDTVENTQQYIKEVINSLIDKRVTIISKFTTQRYEKADGSGPIYAAPELYIGEGNSLFPTLGLPVLVLEPKHTEVKGETTIFAPNEAFGASTPPKSKPTSNPKIDSVLNDESNSVDPFDNINEETNPFDNDSSDLENNKRATENDNFEVEDDDVPF